MPGFTTVTSFGGGLVSDNILSNQSENQYNSDKWPKNRNSTSEETVNMDGKRPTEINQPSKILVMYILLLVSNISKKITN